MWKYNEMYKWMKYRMVVVEGGWSGRDSGNGKLLGCGFIILLRKMKKFCRFVV